VPRKYRIQVAGGIYHVHPRATGGGLFFVDDSDRERMVSLLRLATSRYGWRIHFFTLLGTHFHLLLTTPRPNLSAGMQYVLGVYCQSFNRRHKRFGHLVAERYGGKLVESESHGARLVPYLALNAVRAGLAALPQDWPWSTYASLVGDSPGWDFVTPDWILEQFDDEPARARLYLRNLVADELARL
jgi:putative transposase